MLYNVVLGKKFADEWHLTTDQYGSNFLSNDEICQKIRFGKNVKPYIKYVGENDCEYYKVSNYEISKNIIISNNNKNMNLNIVNFRSSDKDGLKTTHQDSNLIYITLALDTFKLLSYTTTSGVEIVQSYHRNGSYVGCALLVPASLGEENLFTLMGFDREENKFVQYNIKLLNGIVVVEKTDKFGTGVINKLKGLLKKYEKFSINFRLFFNTGKLLTRAYIVSSELEEEFLNATANIKDVIVVSINTEDPITKADIDQLKGMFASGGIKSVTICGLELPKNFCKDTGLMHMFVYDTNTKFSKCVRSN